VQAEQKAEKTSVDLLVELNKNNVELVKNNKDNNAAMVKEFKVFNAAFVAAQLAAANATQTAAVFQVQAAKQAAASGTCRRPHRTRAASVPPLKKDATCTWPCDDQCVRFAKLCSPPLPNGPHAAN